MYSKRHKVSICYTNEMQWLVQNSIIIEMILITSGPIIAYLSSIKCTRYHEQGATCNSNCMIH